MRIPRYLLKSCLKNNLLTICVIQYLRKSAKSAEINYLPLMAQNEAQIDFRDGL